MQSALAADEALLSFQVGIWNTFDGDFGGGSWLIAITRDRRAVYRIPDRSHFAPLVPVFTGLLTRGDGLERSAAVRLLRGRLFDSAQRASIRRPAARSWCRTVLSIASPSTR